MCGTGRDAGAPGRSARGSQLKLMSAQACPGHAPRFRTPPTPTSFSRLIPTPLWPQYWNHGDILRDNPGLDRAIPSGLPITVLRRMSRFSPTTASVIAYLSRCVAGCERGGGIKGEMGLG